MAKQLGTNVLVVNRPGAGGAVGYKYVAGQKPDGYSLVWNSNSISTTYHSGQLAFDYKAFDAVARVLVESPLLAVRGDAKWKSLGEFIADAKARPGKITVANSGTGSHTHISSVALFKAAGAEVADIPYGAGRWCETDRRPRERRCSCPGAGVAHQVRRGERAAALIPGATRRCLKSRPRSRASDRWRLGGIANQGSLGG